MDKHTIKKIEQEHDGKKYEFPIGALAENVETDTEHQFVTREEKEKIGEIDTIKQSFRDGCNTLVSACTTYGAAPASNSPAHIADAIGLIYHNRYNEGRLQGQKDVIADPGAFGIDQIKEIYQHALSTLKYDDVFHSETVLNDLWAKFDHGDTIQYQIPVNTEKFLYAVTFDLEFYAIRGYESPCSVGYEYSLATTEGAVIQSDSVQSGPTGSTTNYGTVTKNIFVDLLQQAFSTEGDHLTLTLKYNMAGQITGGVSDKDNEGVVVQSHIKFSNIQARYK